MLQHPSTEHESQLQMEQWHDPWQHKAEISDRASIVRSDGCTEILDFHQGGHHWNKRHNRPIVRTVDRGSLQVQLSAGEGDSKAGGNQSSVIFGMDLFPGPK